MAVSMLVLTACGKHTVYHTFHTLPSGGWMRNDTLHFNVDISDSVATTCRLTVAVRNHSNYPYCNLPLLIRCTDPHGQTVYVDTIQIQLANQEGIWLGNGWGGLYEKVTPAGILHTAGSGVYFMTVASLLPDEVLPGIRDVGIMLQKTAAAPAQ
ncbi:MAG: gliding motility lipoprotein GldH [Prevotellaceae bacterium]|jgi:gliding motility-associated lipoprotein GldH|nr:gliding motility lipoprotein GldH [Prevotellaceae bacterium]